MSAGVLWTFACAKSPILTPPNSVYKHPEEAILAAELHWQEKGQGSRPNWARHPVFTRMIYSDDYVIYPVENRGEQ